MDGDAGSGQLTPPAPGTADAASPVAASPVSQLAAGRWLPGVCATLAVVSLAFVVAGALAFRANRQAGATERAEVAAVAAAKDCIAATQAPDAKSMLDSQRTIVECATQKYAPQATLYSSLLSDAYQAAQAKVKVTQMRAAAERRNPDGSFDVLVAARVMMSNVQNQDQELSYRLRVRMAPEDCRYKIDSIEPVSK